MPWSLNGDRPIYAQLVEKLQKRIVSGEYPPGTRLLSVRELAEQASVNPNTMQRALSELERLGLVYSQRTAGRFVTEEAERITALRERLAGELLRKFLEEMKSLGFSRAEAAALLRKELQGGEEA